MIKNDYIDNSPIIIYYYYDLSDTDDFCKKLEKWFRRGGHTRELRFISWDCYNELPSRDGDIYCYDAIVLSSLVDKGYLHELPDIISTENVFPWILDRSRIRNKIYGIPHMGCANLLISREEDYTPISNIYQVPKGLSAPLKSMASFYYLYALCNLQDRRSEIVKTLQCIRSLMTDDCYERSRFMNYDGFERFKRGEVRYLIGFAEDIRHLDPGRYKVQLMNLSDGPINEMPLFPVDFASLGVNVSGEKLLDCLDLLEIIADSDFIYDICFSNGRLQYMLPADMTLYPRLEKADPIYRDFYEILSYENNGIIRFGKNYYEDFRKNQAELMKMLENLLNI